MCLRTIHRPESTDNREALRAIVDTLASLGEPVVFPVHPRTRAALIAADLLKILTENEHIILLEPIPYSAILELAAHARVVFTESGGLQKEAYFLGVPVVNPRDRTEWHELVTSGWQTIANYNTKHMQEQLKNAKAGTKQVAGFGNGQAAEIAATAIKQFLLELE